MSTIPNVPYRLEFSVEVPGTPEQVWQAIATAKGMSAWFAPTELEEREGGSLRFVMGPEMDSTGQVTGWDPPRRIVYEEDWAALMGKDPDTLSPLTSEFLVEAQSGGTCVVRVTSSGFGIGADWEQEWWDTLGPGWMPFFDNLRLYLAHFPGQEATHLEVTATHPGDAGGALVDPARRARAGRRGRDGRRARRHRHGRARRRAADAGPAHRAGARDAQRLRVGRWATARRRRVCGRTCSPPTRRTTCGARSRPGRPGCRGSPSRPDLLRGTALAAGAPAYSASPG